MSSHVLFDKTRVRIFLNNTIIQATFSVLMRMGYGSVSGLDEA